MSTSTTIESDPEWEQVTATPPSGAPTPPPPQASAVASSKEEEIKEEEVVEAEAKGSAPPPPSISPPSSSPSTITILSSSDVSTILSTLTLSDFLTSQSKAFQAFSSSKLTSSTSSPSDSLLQGPPRIALHLPNHTTLFMPSRASQVGGTACKIVSVPRSSDDTEGLPATTFVLDEQTGKVVGVVNAGELTGVRTAAGSAVASRMLLGKGEGRAKMVVFGAGVQAFWHTHLHLLLFPPLTFVSFLARPSSTPSNRLLSLIAKLQPLHPNVTFEHSSRKGFDRGQAVHNADIIICCTPSQTPLFPPTQPRSGTHIVLIGSYKPFMLEVAPEMLSSRAGVVFVDGLEETRAEAGELQGYEGEVCEVGSVLGKEGEGRERWERNGKGDLTVFKSVGLAVQDVSITRLVFDKAKELGLGVETEF